MTETDEPTEILSDQAPLKELFERFSKLQPKDRVNRYFVAENADEQKQKFLAGEIENPDHHYDLLEETDFSAKREEIDTLAEEILAFPKMNEHYRPIYEECIAETKDRNRFLATAQALTHADGDERARLGAEYMDLNKELYSEPDEAVFRELLGEKLARLDKKVLTGRAEEVRNELHELLSSIETTSGQERFKPSQETIDWMHEVCESLYANLLKHVPEQESFSDTEIATIFQNILDEEFAGAAEGWEVVIENSASINVKASEKKVVIPTGRELDYETMRGRVVHELGIHVMMPLMGQATDLYPLAAGLPGYYNNEEGKGSIMEQALARKYREAGVDPYITQGLAYFEKLSFREAFEIKWRLGAIGGVKKGADLTDDSIAKSKDIAYKATQRTYRGTDDMPWFQDISYYNGSHDMWQHFEDIQGDDLRLALALLGKSDPTNPDQQRTLLETHTY